MASTVEKKKVVVPKGTAYMKLNDSQDYEQFVADKDFVAEFVSRKMGFDYFSKGELLFKTQIKLS